MKEPSIRIAVDPTLPVGRCLLVGKGLTIHYTGRIGGLTEEMLAQDGAVLILNPVDFADGEKFMKATRH